MKQVKIKKLWFHNFKGLKDFEINFTDNNQIFGDNATGKTTLVDGFDWLLFGKDSTDRKDFSIKTFDSNNNVIHKLDHEVGGIFDINGEEMTLRRVFKEKWVTRRGSQEPELQGHETLFFWNNVPMQAKEYQAKVDEVISEQTFKMITSPFYFNTLKWPDRRNILTSIAGDVTDQDVAGSNKQFSTLLESLGKKTLEEFKKELASKKKLLKNELKQIPARVDEVNRNTPEALDWSSIEKEKDRIEKEIAKIDDKLQDASKISEDFYKNQQLIQKQIHELKTKISNIEYKGQQTFAKNLREKTDAIAYAKSEIEKISNKKSEGADEIKRLNDQIIGWEKRQAELRDEWNKENESIFQDISKDVDFRCPICEQDLPEETVNNKKEQFREIFNRHKSEKLAEISNDGKGYSSKIEKAKSEIDFLKKVDYQSQLSEQNAIIKKWEETKLQTVQAILSDNEEYSKLKRELEELERQPIKKAPEVDNSTLKENKSKLQEELDANKKNLTLKEQIEKSDKRKKELLDEEKNYSSKLSELEQTEFTIEQFTRTKVDMLESRINKMFESVKFRMFDTQLNGGLIECCDTIINGVPWADANNAAKINAGIEIINVLSDHYGQVAPIWIDNAESITYIRSSKAQKVELYVSKAHKKLEVA